jgi:hypothetical protein
MGDYGDLARRLSTRDGNDISHGDQSVKCRGNGLVTFIGGVLIPESGCRRGVASTPHQLLGRSARRRSHRQCEVPQVVKADLRNSAGLACRAKGGGESPGAQVERLRVPVVERPAKPRSRAPLLLANCDLITFMP